ncbi:MAG: GNAT family N-acetyltransferase [Candidatus Saccharimonadales bacterium]
MKPFPTEYVPSVATLQSDELSDAGKRAFETLAARGYAVTLGLTKAAAAKIQEIARQDSIREYCPNDVGSRFRDEAGTTTWLGKGRAVFLLVESATGEIAGYAWGGAAQTSHIPGGETTVALRLSEKHQGKGLATPYLAVAVDATQQLYGAKNLWLETWASNTGAVHIYEKIGFTQVASEPSTRPTINGTLTPDTRLYMMFSQ